jgi:methyltransferase (TIGR00027 family)
VKPDDASRTADRVAERRAAHQVLDAPLVFDDPLAFRVLRPEVADRLRDTPNEFNRSPVAKYLRAFFAVRHRYAEDVLRAAVSGGIAQYVVVGAGFDTFAYRNPFSNLRVFEVDHPATQAVKRQRLASAGLVAPENLSLISADLSVCSLRDALDTSSFDRGEPAVFAWLGVIPYLEIGVVETTFCDISSLPQGTEIVFDYGLPRERLSFIGRVVFDRMAARVAAVGEPWKTFFTPESLQKTIRSLGFVGLEDLGPSEINARYFADRNDRLRVGEAAHLARAIV